MVPPASKRACLKEVQEKLGRKVPPMPVPHSDITRLSSASAIEKEVDQASDGASVGVAATEKVLDKKDTPATEEVCPSKLELEPIVLRVVNESDEEKDM